MAITDHGELAFAPQFYHACCERGMTPLIGCECYFVENARESIERGDERRNHLILIAKNLAGYRTLVRLSSESWLNNCIKGARGLVDWELLGKYHEGLICLSGCYYGSFPLKTIRESREAGEGELRRYLDIFGGDFYPEMSRLGFEEQEISNAAILDLAPRYGLKPVVTNDVHYPYPEDWLAHDIIAKSRFGTVSDFSVVTKAIWLKSAAEMLALGFDPAHVENTALVAAKCDLRLPTPFLFPPVLHGSPSEDIRILRTQCAEAVENRIPAPERASWRKLLRRELRLIGDLDLAGYLLAAAELAQHFPRAQIKVRLLEGRGAGTAVAYLLDLSGTLPSLSGDPDAASFNRLALICPNRGSAMKYLLEKFGPEKARPVAEHVPITGGDALRFTAEVLGVPPDERGGGLAEIVNGDTVAENLSRSAALQSLCGIRPDILTWARRIEGIPRFSRPSPSTLVLTNGSLPSLIPLKRHGETVMAQYDAEGARLAGCLTLELRAPA
jgi:DNA polymerase-3 subunit alpha